MIKYKTILGMVVVSTTISACSTQTKHKESESAELLVAKNIELSLNRIENIQTKLVQMGNLGKDKEKILNDIHFDNQSVSFEWYGDISNALAKIAEKRGYRFYYSGVHLPLPISINVKRISYTNLLQRLQTQIGYRASIEVNHINKEISLRYISPNAKSTDAIPKLSNITDSEYSYGSGKNLNLRKAMLQIIPKGWIVNIKPDLELQIQNQRFDWKGGIRWTNVLDNMLTKSGLRYITDEKLRIVTVLNAQTTIKPTDKPITEVGSSVNKTLATSIKKNNHNSNGYVSAKPKKDSNYEWVANPGTTLKESIISWSQKAKCSSGNNWLVIWSTSIDYRIDARISFSGSYEEAIVKMFGLYQHAEKPLYVLANREQCLISVDDHSREQ